MVVFNLLLAILILIVAGMLLVSGSLLMSFMANDREDRAREVVEFHPKTSPCRD